MSVDWWSLGILIFEMINGLPPFYDTNRKMMYRRILTAPVQKTVYMTPEVGVRGELQRRRTTLFVDCFNVSQPSVWGTTGSTRSSRMGEAVSQGGGASVPADGEERRVNGAD